MLSVSIWSTKNLCIIINFAYLILVAADPCEYHETVDLKNGQLLQNGSYLFDGVVIPPDLIQMYNYKYENHTKLYIEPYPRGCMCKLRKCINWCCGTINQIYEYDKEQCIQSNNKIDSQIQLISFDSNITVDIKTYFYGIFSGIQCNNLYALRKDVYEEDDWHMFENGSVYMPDVNTFLTKSKHCFAIDEPESNQYNFVPFLCSFAKESIDTRDSFYGYCSYFSVFFMVITIIIYSSIPELRKLHGKSLICYLFGLSIGYSILGFLLLKEPTTIGPATCIIIGYICYYFFIASFLWLSIISFDLWWNFGGIKPRNKFTKRQKFIAYSIYSWGLAGLFLVFAIIMQISENIPKKYKPGIGGNSYCFLDVNTNWSAVIYFYGPICLVIFINIILFVLTSLKIYKIRSEISKIMNGSESHCNFERKKNRFGLFLRLFVIMGITWSFEIISYAIGENNKNTILMIALNICNCLQGFLIFILFVWKKKVKMLIFKTYQTKRSKTSRQFSTTTTTTTSNFATTPLKLIMEKPF